MPDAPNPFLVLRILPTDYAGYGGTVEREGDPDCSCGCNWALWLAEPFDGDLCVCMNPTGPRAGLLTFKHQAGRGCFTSAPPPATEGHNANSR
jgi:hypothetical protein